MISETVLCEAVNGIALGANHTVYQFIDQDKVILDRLLVNFSKVGFGDRDEAVAVLEYEGGIGVGSDVALESTCMLKNRLAYLVTATT